MNIWCLGGEWYHSRKCMGASVILVFLNSTHSTAVSVCTHESLLNLYCECIVQILKLTNDAFPFPLFSDSQRQSLRVQSHRVECGGLWTMEPWQDRCSWARQVKRPY